MHGCLNVSCLFVRRRPLVSTVFLRSFFNDNNNNSKNNVDNNFIIIMDNVCISPFFIINELSACDM